MNSKPIAVALAKHVFQIAECHSAGKVIARQRFNRSEFRRYLTLECAPATVIMAACGTANYWGRLAQTAGHQVMLLHARYVKPYRRRNKTDRNDCDAILDAAHAVVRSAASACSPPAPWLLRSVHRSGLKMAACARRGWA